MPLSDSESLALLQGEFADALNDAVEQLGLQVLSGLQETGPNGCMVASLPATSPLLTQRPHDETEAAERLKRFNLGLDDPATRYERGLVLAAAEVQELDMREVLVRAQAAVCLVPQDYSLTSEGCLEALTVEIMGVSECGPGSKAALNALVWASAQQLLKLGDLLGKRWLPGVPRPLLTLSCDRTPAAQDFCARLHNALSAVTMIWTEGEQPEGLYRPAGFAAAKVYRIDRMGWVQPTAY